MSASLPSPPHAARLMMADGEGFVTRPVACFDLTLLGLEGDRHMGLTRAADARTSWHKRGVTIANTRQLSLVSLEECGDIARILGIAEVDPALLGANIVLAGVPDLSMMPPAWRIQFPSGATVFITEQNAPCRLPADKLARSYGEPRLAAAFGKAAIGRRGLVGLVERAGPVVVGDAARCFPSPAQVTRPKLEVPRLL